MAAKQKVVSVESAQGVLEEEREDDELRDTKAAFYQYVFVKASQDKQLTREETVTLNEVKEELESSEDTRASGEAAEMGRRLAVIGEWGGGDVTRVMCEAARIIWSRSVICQSYM